MTDNSDLIVIEAGSVGLTRTRTAAALAARWALVERDRIGGAALLAMLLVAPPLAE